MHYEYLYLTIQSHLVSRKLSMLRLEITMLCILNQVKSYKKKFFQVLKHDKTTSQMLRYYYQISFTQLYYVLLLLPNLT